MVLGIVLVAAIAASAIGVVASKHQTRSLFTALQEARTQHGTLVARHAQLELEHSTWANVERVRRIARDSLNMRPPKQYYVLRGHS
ncbi:cell division protein FtsL [Salinisphaera sp. USBA-960]|nr:cell division protein FtsL [Salifodinibacter halophilus]NNC26765.1 cell division protein FtsL [Salifodinibacter halophilus]